ncbi:MAG: CPBP family intramembrane metalloprotease [Lachnospiraceae bacterium]|nr:CPBP family intramembrane metalloprotease [Lachnospiraceae bacterium]
MKNWIRTYRLFSPDLFTILFVLLGTPVFFAGTFLFSSMFGATVGVIVALALFSSLDIMTDFFVFQGILDKKFDFGILALSQKGPDLLRRGILTDVIRRLIQYLVISAGCAINLGRQFSEAGTPVGGVSLAGITLSLAFGFLFTELLALNVMRKYTHYTDGMLAFMLASAVQVLADLGLAFALATTPGMNSLCWALVLGILAACAIYVSEERILLRFINFRGDREQSRFITEDRKKLPVFLLIAFGVDFLMIPVMIVGYNRGQDLSVFLIAQMMYPACGVVMAKLFARDEKKLPKAAYVTILVAGILTMICCMVQVGGVIPEEMGGAAYAAQLANVAIIVTTIFFLIFVCACGREKRENAGMRFHRPLVSILMILLFVLLYFARIAILYGLSAASEGDISILTEGFTAMFSGRDALALWGMVLLNAPLTIIMFLGEEYGWRYFLQPILQKRFGALGGTLLLGVLWGLWHVGADFYFYSDGTGLQMLVQQLVTCVSLGIFFAYAYMKTGNIWVPVMMHFLNNNLILVISGDPTGAAMQGNVVSWSMIPLSVIGASVFWLFALSPVFRQKKDGAAKTGDAVSAA